MRTLDVDKLTSELKEQQVTIAGQSYRLVVKDNAVTRRIRDDGRELARLGRDAAALEKRTKTADEQGADEKIYAAIAKDEDKLELEVVAIRRRMIGVLLHDDDGNPPPAPVLDGLDSAVIGRLFDFVLEDPLAAKADPTSGTANGGGTPPS